MSQPSRPLNPSIRHPSLGGLQSSSGQSPLLLSRINEKKAELENLKQLRDLSGGLAAQMEALEQKLSTLSNGTEAVATVLSNWHNVMRAINMASIKIPKPTDQQSTPVYPKPENTLPQTLVRVPAEQSEDFATHQNSPDSSE